MGQMNQASQELFVKMASDRRGPRIVCHNSNVEVLFPLMINFPQTRHASEHMASLENELFFSISSVTRLHLSLGRGFCTIQCIEKRHSTPLYAIVTFVILSGCFLQYICTVL